MSALIPEKTKKTWLPDTSHRLWRLLLVASLMINLAILGVLLGQHYRSNPMDRPGVANYMQFVPQRFFAELPRERRRELRFVADGDAINLAIAQGTEDDADEEWSDAVARALGLLPLEQREAFLLRYVEEMNYEEMVEITGVGLSALKMRVKRACEALRVSLEEVNHG